MIFTPIYISTSREIALGIIHFGNDWWRSCPSPMSLHGVFNIFRIFLRSQTPLVTSLQMAAQTTVSKPTALSSRTSRAASDRVPRTVLFTSGSTSGLTSGSDQCERHLLSTTGKDDGTTLRGVVQLSVHVLFAAGHYHPQTGHRPLVLVSAYVQ